MGRHLFSLEKLFTRKQHQFQFWEEGGEANIVDDQIWMWVPFFFLKINSWFWLLCQDGWIYKWRRVASSAVQITILLSPALRQNNLKSWINLSIQHLVKHYTHWTCSLHVVLHEYGYIISHVDTQRILFAARKIGEGVEGKY